MPGDDAWEHVPDAEGEAAPLHGLSVPDALLSHARPHLRPHAAETAAVVHEIKVMLRKLRLIVDWLLCREIIESDLNSGGNFTKSLNSVEPFSHIPLDVKTSLLKSSLGVVDICIRYRSVKMIH